MLKRLSTSSTGSGKISPKDSPKGSPKGSPKNGKISPTRKDSPKGSPKGKPKDTKKEDVKGFFTIYARNINDISYKSLLDRMDQGSNAMIDKSSWAAMDGLRELIADTAENSQDKKSDSQYIDKLIKAKDPILLKTFIDKHLNQNRLIILYQQRRILKGTREKEGNNGDNHYFAAIGTGDTVYVIQGTNVDSMKREELADIISNIASGKSNKEKRKYRFTLYAYNRKILYPDIITEYLKAE